MKERGRPELHSPWLEMGGAGRQCKTMWVCETEGTSPETFENPDSITWGVGEPIGCTLFSTECLLKFKSGSGAGELCKGRQDTSTLLALLCDIQGCQSQWLAVLKTFPKTIQLLSCVGEDGWVAM